MPDMYVFRSSSRSEDHFMRILQLIGLYGRVALTTGGMVLNLRALPERHPALPLNQAKYYVVYFEIIILGLCYMYTSCRRYSRFCYMVCTYYIETIYNICTYTHVI